MMKDRKEDIDLLLDRNTAEQLAKVDWDGLNAGISNRLDKADRGKASVRRYPPVFKVAAGIAAAAVVLIAVMVGTDKQADVQLDGGRRAVVNFVESKGSTTVEIGRSDGRVARCDIEIIDLNGQLEEKGSKAAWIIISRPEPMFADNGVNRDMSDMICLF